MPAPGTQTYSMTTDKAIAAEAMRGGPRGEARIFETPEELNELARGASPKYMNGQFRYYLASVVMMQPQGECKTPLLAVNVAVENLHGTPTVAIYGEFTFTQIVGGDGSSMTETVATPFHANILGPFSNKQGGLVYATAFLEQTDAARDPDRWAKIAAISPQRLKVWFKPEAFYYADGTQYAQRTGKVAGAARRAHLRRPRRRPVADQVARRRAAPRESAPRRRGSAARAGSPPVGAGVDPSHRAPGRRCRLRRLLAMDTREMLRLSWRAWLHQGAPRVGPWWIGHAWTLAFGLGVAAVLSVVTLASSSDATRAIWPTVVAANVIISLTITFAVRGAFWLGAARGRRPAGSPPGAVAALALLHDRADRRRRRRLAARHACSPAASTSASWRRSCGPACSARASSSRSSSPPLFQQFFRTKTRQIAAENAATEAQLRLLQAQIEPHFLFNTLANVVSLMEADPPRAKSMLESFVDYLRASLSGLGQATHTLGDEIDLIDAYMRIIKIRMEDRLEYAIEVPGGAARPRACRR